MKIRSKVKEYTVNIEDDFNFLKPLIEQTGTYYVIDKNVFEIYKEKVFRLLPKDKLFILNAEEVNKNINSALEICEKITIMPEKRNVNLVSIGGGIVQDVTGFVANILYRGINWTFVPTTLLAACDSCIGGKTSLNYKNFKNLLGTFFPPDEIFICSKFFETLTTRDFNSGLGEVVKFNVMTGITGVDNLEKNLTKLLERDKKTVDIFLENSLLFKKPYIEEDEFDKGIRIHLNFAHTFGHAFETISNYQIPHGTAVAMGMLVANRISLSREMLAEATVEKIEAMVERIININVDKNLFEEEKIIAAIKKDKKQTNLCLTGVLLNKEIKTEIVRDISAEEIMVAVDYVLEFLKLE